jgi:hypothetical protein
MRAEGRRAARAAALIDPNSSAVHQARACLTRDTDFVGYAT